MALNFGLKLRARNYNVNLTAGRSMRCHMKERVPFIKSDSLSRKEYTTAHLGVSVKEISSETRRGISSHFAVKK